MRIAHLLPARPHARSIAKFFATYSEDMGVDAHNHVFVVFQTHAAEVGEQREFCSLDELPARQLILVPASLRRILKTLWSLRGFDVFIIHNGAIRREVWIPFVLPWLWRKTALVTWGGDVYIFKQRRDASGIRSKLGHLIDRTIVPNLRAVCTLTPGEYRIIRSVFRKCDNYHRAFYSSQRRRETAPSLDVRTPVTVLLNQSAHFGGRHIEALDYLEKFRQCPIRIICPLSYGPKGEADSIADHGRAVFGAKFKPLTHMLPFGEYTREVINNCSIFVLNHLTQNGLGTAYAFLSQGKVVYLRKESPVREMLGDFGIETRDAASIPSLSFEEFAKPLSRESAESNIRAFNEHLSVESAVSAWSGLFDLFRARRGAPAT